MVACLEPHTLASGMMLPVELFHHIISCLEQKDLLSLVTVSRIFQAEAERRIFRRISFLSHSLHIAQRCKFLLAIPRVFLYIQEFKMIEVLPPKARRRRLSPFYTLVTSVLQRLQNLVTLVVAETFSDATLGLCGQLFHCCTFQLRFLQCHFTLDRDFASFLHAQREITEFRWKPSYYSSPTYLSPTAFPNLAVLTVWDCAWPFLTPSVHDIITGRPVAHLTWRVRGHQSDLLLALANSTAQMKSLRMSHLDSTTLVSLPSYFAELEFLSLIDLLHNDVGHYAPTLA
jgi:hypothetical protein